MARPVDEAKRREIADAALAVLRERGVAGTGMSHIADALGMKRPTLYWYFGSIAELFEYAVERLREDEVRFVAERLQGVDHPLDALFAMIANAMAFYRARGLDDFVFLLCQGWAAGDRAQRDRFSLAALRFLDPARELLVGLVQLGVAQGRVRPVDAERLVDTALSVLHGAIVHEVLTGVSAEPSLSFFREAVLEPLRLPLERR